ncbi:hypothetical protein GPECTOR_5g160 [Gonium pectorale]|uniref:DM2 domain-containing protein n=1 Tax=Gonium pectorale TaxID=33097 RepID=A0A150GWG8_GONPE|nr:hypothetical protein GPECTOR_5g160 [Gonium pectorale]|eukprot:KXZ54052.1 hypothetical protein GPECTOR_5g160 [Gonium pectorale]
MAVTDQQLLERLRVLLGESDLQTTTEKMLRKKLEEEFKMELADKKPLIRQEIERYLAEQGGDSEEEEEEGSDDARAPRRGSSLGCILSEPLAKFLGEESLPRTQVVKRLWEYIKEKNLQDPKDKRKILLDDKLKTIFTSPLTMFTMNTQLSKHCKTNDAVDDDRPAKRSAQKSSKAEPKSKRAKGADGEGEGEGAKKPNGFTKQLRLTPEMAEWTARETMSRPELTAFFWSYVKQHNLQDPSNKQFILCDESLKKLTGEDRISGFGHIKHLAKHFLKD